MKRTLVLSGGGTKGIYQAGVVLALKDIDAYHFDKVIGVSVGSLNAGMLVQDELDRWLDMYEKLSPEQIVNGFIPTDMSIRTLFQERDEFIDTLQYYVKEHGIDIHPFYDFVHYYYNPEKFFASSMDYACVVATKKDHSGVFVSKEMMKEKGEDWLIASCSAYPIFPVKVIDGNEYIDGGYYDNCPIDFALQDGADEVVAIEMHEETIHPVYKNKKIVHLIHPKAPLYDFLCFDREKMQRAKIIGYNDAMKHYRKYDGYRYTFLDLKVPSYFDVFEREMLLLETKIKMATSVSERIRSEQIITDTLKERMHVSYINDKYYYLGMLDALMELCEMDETKVYTMQEATNQIIAMFAHCAYEDYPYKPSFIPTELLSYIRGLDKKTIVSMLLHAKFYPTHTLLKENMMLTLYPFEAAMAQFLYIMMMHI